MTLDWTIGEINRRRVPLAILWAEQKLWRQRIEDAVKVFTCIACGKRFDPAPDLCITCGDPVCGNCYPAHRRGHWKPVRTIGGDSMCDGKRVFCGHDQCPKCHGVPF